MGLKTRKFQRKRHEEEQDFELNIASIIDCFTVVITYLLVSASFISLGVLDTSSADGSVSIEQVKKETLELTIHMSVDRQLILNTSGTQKSHIAIPALNGSWDFTTMNNYLQDYKNKFNLQAANLSAANAVEYKDVVRGLERIREQIANVYLGDEESP